MSVRSVGLTEAGGPMGLEELGLVGGCHWPRASDACPGSPQGRLTVSICFTPMQLLAFLQGLFTFYHHGYELAKDFSDFKTELTISIQNVSARAAVPHACPARKLTRLARL